MPGAAKNNSKSSPCDIDYACKPLHSALQTDILDAAHGSGSGSGSLFTEIVENITATPSNETSPSDQGNSTKMTVAVIVGIAAGAGLLFFGSAALFIVYWLRLRRFDREDRIRYGGHEMYPPYGERSSIATTNRDAYFNEDHKEAVFESQLTVNNYDYYHTAPNFQSLRPAGEFEPGRPSYQAGSSDSAIPAHPAYIPRAMVRRHSPAPPATRPQTPPNIPFTTPSMLDGQAAAAPTPAPAPAPALAPAPRQTWTGTPGPAGEDHQMPARRRTGGTEPRPRPGPGPSPTPRPSRRQASYSPPPELPRPATIPVTSAQPPPPAPPLPPPPSHPPPPRVPFLDLPSIPRMRQQPKRYSPPGVPRVGGAGDGGGGATVTRRRYGSVSLARPTSDIYE